MNGRVHRTRSNIVAIDVNDPDSCRLLRYINLPAQWTTRAGFDAFLVEGYRDPGIDADLDKATHCALDARRELAWTRHAAVTWWACTTRRCPGCESM